MYLSELRDWNFIGDLTHYNWWMASQLIVSTQNRIQDNADCEQARFRSFEWDQIQLQYLGPNFGVGNIQKSFFTLSLVVRLTYC